jgi:hypothetical protein
LIDEMKFSRIVFNVAGIYGLLALLPQYFMEEKTGLDYPPAITHPAYFYGFLGVAVAFQIVFLIIARNPARHRALMIPAMIEKFSFVIAAFVLLLQNRIATPLVAGAAIDLVLGILFVIAYFKTESAEVLR